MDRMMHNRGRRRVDDRDRLLPDVIGVGKERRELEEADTPVRIANEVTRVFQDLMQSDLSWLPISYRSIMYHLGRNESLNQFELVRLTHLKPPTISVTLQKMESEGYVTRESDDRDMRRIHVTLTDLGREYNEKVQSRIKEIDNMVASALNEKEQKQLCELLGRVRDTLYEQLPDNEKGAQNVR